MNKPMDIIGKKFNRLTVLELVGTDKYGNTKFLCECDCGNRKILLGSKVKVKKFMKHFLWKCVKRLGFKHL